MGAAAAAAHRPSVAQGPGAEEQWLFAGAAPRCKVLCRRTAARPALLPVAMGYEGAWPGPLLESLLF